MWPRDHPRVGIVSFVVDGHTAREVAERLSADHGIGVRDGKFCAHPFVRHLLGVGQGGCDEIGGAVRASIGIGSTEEHVDRLLAALPNLPDARLTRGGKPDRENPGHPSARGLIPVKARPKSRFASVAGSGWFSVAKAMPVTRASRSVTVTPGASAAAACGHQRLSASVRRDVAQCSWAAPARRRSRGSGPRPGRGWWRPRW